MSYVDRKLVNPISTGEFAPNGVPAREMFFNFRDRIAKRTDFEAEILRIFVNEAIRDGHTLSSLSKLTDIPLQSMRNIVLGVNKSIGNPTLQKIVDWCGIEITVSSRSLPQSRGTTHTQLIAMHLEAEESHE